MLEMDPPRNRQRLRRSALEPCITFQEAFQEPRLGSSPIGAEQLESANVGETAEREGKGESSRRSCEDQAEGRDVDR